MIRKIEIDGIELDYYDIDKSFLDDLENAIDVINNYKNKLYIEYEIDGIEFYDDGLIATYYEGLYFCATDRIISEINKLCNYNQDILDDDNWGVYGFSLRVIDLKKLRKEKLKKLSGVIAD